MGRRPLFATVAVLWLSAACGTAEEQATPEQEASVPGTPVAPEVESSIDWTAVDAALGRTGATQPGGEYRFNMPRSDLNVTVDGVQIQPSLSLGSWVAFMPSGGNEAVVMGDLVLTEEEYNPVIARLQQGEIGQTAVHKHLPEHTPDLWWTHVHGRGNPVQLAQTVREAVALTSTPASSPPPATPPPFDLDTAQIGSVAKFV